VLPIPEWITAGSTQLPSEREIEPGYAAVSALWDTPALCDAVAARGRQIAERYAERVSCKKHVDYFLSIS
jgi:hypothetical protein